MPCPELNPSATIIFGLNFVHCTLGKAHMFGARGTLVNGNIMALNPSGMHAIGLRMLHLDFDALANSQFHL